MVSDLAQTNGTRLANFKEWVVAGRPKVKKWLGFRAVGPSSGETDRGYHATNCSPGRFFFPLDALRSV